MAGVDVYYTALDRCRKAMLHRADDFEALFGIYPAGATNSSIFAGASGSLSKEPPSVSAMTEAANALAKVIDGIEGSVKGTKGSISSEGDIITGNLREIGRALDQIEDNLREADRAGEA